MKTISLLALMTPASAQVTIVEDNSKDKQCAINLSEAQCKSAAQNSKRTYGRTANWGHSVSPGCWVSGTSMYFNTATSATSNKGNSHVHLCNGNGLKSIDVPTANFVEDKTADKQCAVNLSEQECKDEAFKRRRTYGRTANWGHSVAPGCWVSGSSMYFNRAEQSESNKGNTHVHLCNGQELKPVVPPTADFVWVKNKDKQCNQALTEQECKDEAFKLRMTFGRTAMWGHYTAPGCWRSGSTLYYNSASDDAYGKGSSNQGNAGGHGHLCNGDELKPLSQPDGFWVTSGNQKCEHPADSELECIKAAFDHRYGFSRSANWGNSFPKGCLKVGSTLYFNTAASSTKVPSASRPIYCFAEPQTTPPTRAPTLPPTDAPTNAPTDAWQGEKECNPKHCSDWTCKDWCTCFSSDALLVEVFEGETPTKDDLYAREMCLTDDDDCNCDMYE